MKTRIILLLFVYLSISVQSQQVIDGDLYLGQFNTIEKGWGSKLFFRGASHNGYDEMMIGRYNIGLDTTELRISIGDDFRDRFVVGTALYVEPNPVFHKFFTVNMTGNVGIGIEEPTEKLDVNGNIRAKNLMLGDETNNTYSNITILGPNEPFGIDK